MYNYLILCTKTGIALRHYGQLPRSIHRDIISNQATMILDYSKFNDLRENGSVIREQNFWIIIPKEGEPYALASDYSIIKMLEGNYLNAVVSINSQDDITPALSLLNEKDKPVKFTGEVFKPSLDEILDDLYQELVRLAKR